MDDRLAKLERRINDFMEQSAEAEKIALEKLLVYPRAKEPLSPIEVLRRERLRHHTRSVMLQEVQEWIRELRDSSPTDNANNEE